MMEKYQINIKKDGQIIERIDKVLDNLDHARKFATRQLEKYEGDKFTIWQGRKRVG